MEKCFLVLGLDNAGKTSVRQAFSEVSLVWPMAGFEIESVKGTGTALERFRPPEKCHFKLVSWNMRRHETIRQHWNPYFDIADGLLFVVDGADSHRLAEARQELHRLIEELPNVPVSILANKQDLMHSLPAEEVFEAMGFTGDQPWGCQACSAREREGVQDGVDCLLDIIRSSSVSSL